MKVSPDFLVSIIVPLHNDEENIKYCLESLMTQTYKNIEIIVVENGSCDKGYFVCQHYAYEDNRIKLFSIEQVGVSKARNYGLDIANGKYVFFCDSDDYMEKNMVEKMVHELERNDCSIVVCGYERVDYHKHQEGVSKATRPSIIWNRDDLVERMFLDDAIRGAVWNKGFTREIIGETRFENELTYCEDFHFLMQILSKNKTAKIRCLDAKLYNYYINPNSATQNRTKTLDVNGNSKYVAAFKKMLTMDFSSAIKDLICASIYRDTISALIWIDPCFLKNTGNVLYEDKRQYKEKYFCNKRIDIKDKIRMLLKLCIIKIGGK